MTLKFPKKKVTIVVLPVVLFAVCYSAIPRPNINDLERESHSLTGANFVDCGIVGIGCVIGDKTQVKADGCAVAAYITGKPFRLRYDYYPFGGTRDSHRVILMTPQQDVYELSFSEAEYNYRNGVFGFFARGAGPTPLKKILWKNPQIVNPYPEEIPQWKQLAP